MKYIGTLKNQLSVCEPEERGWLLQMVWHLIPVYRGLRVVKRGMVFTCNSLPTFGIQTTGRLWMRMCSAWLRRSMINGRLKRSVQALAGSECKLPGSSVKQGTLYHDLISPDGILYDSHRKNSLKRLRYLKNEIPVRDARILDIGCSNGSLALGLGLMHACRVVGVDYDERAIGVAECVRDKYKIGNVEFEVRKIYPQGNHLPKTDVLIWLSNWMWLVKEYGLEHGLKLLFDIPVETGAEYMVFESAANDGMAPIEGTNQSNIEQYLVDNSPFQFIRNIGPFPDGWRKPGSERNIFVCSNQKLVYQGRTAEIRRTGHQTIRKRYKPEYCWMKDIELECMRRLDGYSFVPAVLYDGVDYIDMSYCGRPVKDASQVCNLQVYVEQLNARGIKHCDLCPENLLYMSNQLYIIDYGWALLDEETRVNDEKSRHLGRGFYSTATSADLEAAARIQSFFQTKP